MKIEIRDQNKKPDWYRKQGLIPGVIYGPDLETTMIYVNKKDFLKFKEEHETGLVEIKFKNEPLMVILQEIQYDPVTEDIIHFDLYAPSKKRKMVAKVPVVFIGEAPAVRKGFILSFNLNEIEVESLPEKLPEKIEVDISGLEEAHQSIYVKDLKIDPDVKILISPENPIVTVIEEEKPTETSQTTITT